MRRRIAWTALALLLITCALPLLGYVAYDLQGRRLLQAEVDKTTGEPLTTDELDAYQGVPEGVPDNTQQWLAILQTLDTPNYREMGDFMPIMGIGLKLPPLPEPIPDEDRIAIEHFLATQRPKLDRIAELAQEPGGMYLPRDFREVPLEFMQASQVRSAIRLLSLEFQLLARQPELDSAIRNVHSQIAIAETLQLQASPTHMLIRVAVVGVTLANVRELLQHRELSDDQLVTIQRYLRDVSLYPQLYKAILAERGQVYKAFHLSVPWGAEAQDLLGPVDTSRDIRGIRRPRDCALALELMNRSCAAAKLPLSQALPLIEGISDEIDVLRKDQRYATRWKYQVTILYFDSFNSMLPMARAVARGETELALMQAAIGVRRYLRAHRKPPATLGALLPEYLDAVPLDPQDGQPLRYRVDQDQAVVYSVGRDRIDNQGLTDLRDPYALDMAEVIPLQK